MGNQDDQSGIESKLISTRCLKLVESMTAAEMARLDHEQGLHYAPRDFVLTGLPYKRLPKEQHTHERHNGRFHFQVVGHPTYGIPYGQDRLIPFWLASAYQAQGCPSNRTIVFRSAGDILRCYGMEPNGRTYTRLRERIERVFGATYFVRNRTLGCAPNRPLRSRFHGDDVIRAESYRIIQSVQLCLNKNQRTNQHTLWQNNITISAEFARDVSESAIPVDIESVRALKTKPAVLDLYVWQAWRSWRLSQTKTHSVKIPIRGESGLLSQLGTEAKEEWKAMQLLRSAQKCVQAIWRQCPNSIEGDTFVVRPGKAVRAGNLQLPGVNNPPRGAGQLRLTTQADEVGHALVLDQPTT